MPDDDIPSLFAAYLGCADEVFSLFEQLNRDWGNADLRNRAYAAKDRRTIAIAALMSRLRSDGVDSLVEGHRRYFTPAPAEG